MRRSLLGLAVVAAMALSIPFAGPAGAVTDTCAAPGGIGMFPNSPGGQSTLMVACTLTTADAGSSTFYKTEDFSQAVWHPGASRQVTGGTTSGSPTLTLTAGKFTAADVNHPISGYQASTLLNGAAATGIPAGAFIKTFTDATHAQMNVNADATVSAKKWAIENTDSRMVTDGSVTIATTSLTSPTANFRAGDVGRTVTGTEIAHATTIASVTNATTAVMSKPATGTASGTEQVTIAPAANQTTSRFVHDAVTTCPASPCSKTVTSASANFQSWDVNLPVTGTNIAAGAVISKVTNATTITISKPATAAGSGGSLTIGQPGATAPRNGDTGMNLGAELNLNPSLVAGSDPCSANTPEGFVISGHWNNPSAYDGSISFGGPTDPSLNQPTIAQLVVPTAVVAFAGYVEQVKAGLAGETTAAAHYDVVFPILPTALAICGAPNTEGVASTFEFPGTLHSQASLPTGIGMPGSAAVRELLDTSAATVSSTAVLHVRATDTSTTDTFTASQVCNEQRPDVSDFGCGQG